MNHVGRAIIAAIIFLVPNLALSGSEVWVGAPFSGSWPGSDGCSNAKYPSNTCSLPKYHWTAFGGQWSADWPKSANATVKLYVAPQIASDLVETKVESVSASCKDGRKGGMTVKIGVYVQGAKVGTLAYAHLNPTVKAGYPVARWGGTLGTVFSTTTKDPLCWTGPHVHFEAANVSGYSCYNGGFSAGQSFSATNFVGFVGGKRVNGPRLPCP